jgi:hypothetical protein
MRSTDSTLTLRIVLSKSDGLCDIKPEACGGPQRRTIYVDPEQRHLQMWGGGSLDGTGVRISVNPDGWWTTDDDGELWSDMYLLPVHENEVDPALISYERSSLTAS